MILCVWVFQDMMPLGDIRVEELLSVERCEEEGSKEHRHCFEVNTQGRGYLFSTDSEEELVEWIDTFQKIISSDAAENLVSGWSIAGGHAIYVDQVQFCVSELLREDENIVKCERK